MISANKICWAKKKQKQTNKQTNNKVNGVRLFKKAMQKNKYKLNVGIAINLIHKKTKKAAMSKLVVSSGEKFTRSCL